MPPLPPPQSVGSNNNNNNNNNPVSLDMDTITGIVRGLHDATVSGSTRLPMRDVPVDTAAKMPADPVAQPNYIPPAPAGRDNYLPPIDAAGHEHHVRFQEPTMPNDAIYDELYFPAFVTVLFFIFQLPAVRDIVYRIAPSMCNGDGSMYTTAGSALVSIAVGGVMYAVCKGLGLGV